MIRHRVMSSARCAGGFGASVVAVLGVMAVASPPLSSQLRAGEAGLSFERFAAMTGYPVIVPFDSVDDADRPLEGFKGVVRLDYSSLAEGADGGQSGSVDESPVSVDGSVAPANLSASDSDEAILAADPAGVRSAIRPGREGSALGLMKVHFDLAGQSGASGGFSVRKPLIANGVAYGDVELRIMGDTRIFVNANQISGLLADRGERGAAAVRKAAGGNGFVEFDDMRAAGIDVRYDPVRDRIVLST